MSLKSEVICRSSIMYWLEARVTFLLSETISRFWFTLMQGLAVIAPGPEDRCKQFNKVCLGSTSGGFRIAPSDIVSLRVHAQLLSPVQGAGGGFYFGTGGEGVGVSTYSTIYQFNVGRQFKLQITITMKSLIYFLLILAALHAIHVAAPTKSQWTGSHCLC